MTAVTVSAAISIALLCAAAVFFFRRSFHQRAELRRLEAELDRLRQEAGRMDLDTLTGLENRAALARWIEEERGFEGQVVVCDLDDFKALNDRYGHLVGDEILHGVGQLIRASIRQEDRGYRWGGDEFVIFFRNSERAVVETRVQELEERLVKFQIRNHGPVPIRFSWGMAATASRPLQESLDEADRLMLEAKRRRQGGDR